MVEHKALIELVQRRKAVLQRSEQVLQGTGALFAECELMLSLFPSFRFAVCN